jgi:hypothetical protein
VALSYEPAENMVALTFLDEEDGEHDEDSGGPAMVHCDDLVIAQVEAVGKKVTVCKAKDLVFVDKWARQGLKLGDERLVEAYCVKALIKK